MKRLLVAETRYELLSTLEVILKHWGYRVLALTRPDDILQSLATYPPDLLIVGADLLQSPSEPLNRALRHLLQDPTSPTLVLKNQADIALRHSGGVNLDVPIDLFVLFESVQTYLEKHPRRNLRMAVALPGMVCQKERSNLAEVISVSKQGLFIKTNFQLGDDETLRVILPLLGMNKELDLRSRVIYRMEPSLLNNYQQGVGIEFTELSENESRDLEDYLEKQFLEELADSQRGPDLDPSQIRLHSAAPVKIVRLP